MRFVQFLFFKHALVQHFINNYTIHVFTKRCAGLTYHYIQKEI